MLVGNEFQAANGLEFQDRYDILVGGPWWPNFGISLKPFGQQKVDPMASRDPEWNNALDYMIIADTYERGHWDWTMTEQNHVVHCHGIH